MSDLTGTRRPAPASPAPTATAGPQLRPAEQREAIDDRGRDLFLAAGAGTGKTTVLVQRFCDAVCAGEGDEAGVGVENVLAFTFTERAADELKRRIRSEFMRRAEEAVADGNPAGRQAEARRLRSCARDSETAWISTIHSFCQRVLASHPLAAGLDPGFRVLDESEAARVGAEAFDAAFGRFGERGGDDRFEVAAAYRLPALRRLIRAAHDELRARGAERPALPALEPPDVAAAVGTLRTAAAEALASTAAAKRTKQVERCRSLIAEALAATESGTPSEEAVEGWSFSGKSLDGAEVKRYNDACAALGRRLVEARFAHHYEHLRELLELYAGEYEHRKRERSSLDFEDLQLRARRLLVDRPDVRHRFQRQFRHLMVDEFQDTNALQLAIVRLLHLEDGAPQNRLFTVGDELQSIYGFRHADVEVFRSQRDAAATAPDDEAGLRQLTGNFRSSPPVLASVNRIGRVLFGADYEELALGAAWAEGHAAEWGEPAVEVLVTEQKGWDEEGVGLEVSPDERAQAWRIAEARLLARRLRELHREGVPRGAMVVLLRSFSYVEAYEDALEAAGLAPYVVGGRGYWSKQQVTDVRNLLGCVANPLDDKVLLGALASPACGVAPDTLWLLRKAAGAAPVWSALWWAYGPERRSEVEPGSEAVESEPDGAAVEAPDIGSADEPAPSSQEPRTAWRARVRGLTGHVPAEDATALREFTAALLDLRDAAPRLSLEALIDRVVTATGYDLALLMRRPRGRRRMANVRKLMRLAREFEADEGRDLRAFIDFVATEAELEGREAEAAIDAEGHDGVRVMTVHAAKGLEFPVVAVADLGRRLVAGAGPALRFEPAASDDGGGPAGDSPAARVGLRLARLGRKQIPVFDYAELQERAVERERQEELRILHVAMTRAERGLILSGALELEKLHDEPKPTDPLIAPILRALRWRVGVESVELEPPRLRPGLDGELDSLPAAVRIQVPADVPGGESPSVEGPAAEAESPGAASEDRALQDPDMSPLPAAPAAAVRAVSYSALSLYERCGYRFYAERVLGMRPRLPGGSKGAAAATPMEVAEAGRSRPEGGERASDERHPAHGAEDLATRYGRGRVVHELLERSARQGWSAPEPRQVEDLLRREGVSADRAEVERATRLVHGFLGAPLRSELGAARVVHPEVPFAFRAGELVVRGEIDLLADLGDEVLVVDYKSDALAETAPVEHMGRYEVQRQIYALAALRRYGRPVRVAYVFLERAGEPVEARFVPDEAPRITAALEAMTGAIAAGRFGVTDRPQLSLCLDCPARERLCVHGPERTLSESG